MASIEFCCTVINDRFIIKARQITKQQLLEAHKLKGNFFLELGQLKQGIDRMVKRGKRRHVVIDWLYVSSKHPRFFLLLQVIELLQKDGRPEIAHCGMTESIKKNLIDHRFLRPDPIGY